MEGAPVRETARRLEPHRQMIEVATAGGDKEVDKPPDASIKELRGYHRSGVERAQDHIQDSALCPQEGGYAYSLARRTEGQGLRGRGTLQVWDSW